MLTLTIPFFIMNGNLQEQNMPRRSTRDHLGTAPQAGVKRRTRPTEEEDASAGGSVRRGVKRSATEDHKAFLDSSVALALRRRIEKCKNSNGLLKGRAIEKFANALEQVLSVSNGDVASYSGASSSLSSEQALNDRLRQLLLTVLKRRITKNEISRYGAPVQMVDRTTTLSLTKTKECNAVVQEILQAKLGHTRRGCTGCKEDSNTSCTLAVITPGTMPVAVRNLFFETSLVKLWGKSDSSNLTASEWQEHLDQAVQNMQAFRSFMGQKHHSKDDDR